MYGESLIWTPFFGAIYPLCVFGYDMSTCDEHMGSPKIAILFMFMLIKNTHINLCNLVSLRWVWMSNEPNGRSGFRDI